MSDITFSMIKPEAYAAGHTGSILAEIEKAGFRIVALRLTQLSMDQARAFYLVHKERPFYEDLCAYISSGPVVAMILRKANAVSTYRTLLGATDPKQAKPDTLRALFATSVEQNAVHGSDSDVNAVLESEFFFSEADRLE